MAVKLPAKDCLSRYASFGMNVLKLWTGIEAADDETYTSRNHECSRCDLFHVPRGTCGVPGDVFLDPQTGKIRSFGCWCHLESANRILGKDCWARFNGLDFGWPDAIRPSHKKSM